MPQFVAKSLGITPGRTVFCNRCGCEDQRGLKVEFRRETRTYAEVVAEFGLCLDCLAFYGDRAHKHLGR